MIKVRSSANTLDISLSYLRATLSWFIKTDRAKRRRFSPVTVKMSVLSVRLHLRARERDPNLSPKIPPNSQIQSQLNDDGPLAEAVRGVQWHGGEDYCTRRSRAQSKSINSLVISLSDWISISLGVSISPPTRSPILWNPNPQSVPTLRRRAGWRLQRRRGTRIQKFLWREAFF